MLILTLLSKCSFFSGKRICWNYRKGRCRFGHNCKYAHDSDIQKTQEQLDAEKDVARGQSVVCQSGVTGARYELIHLNSEKYIIYLFIDGSSPFT